MSGKKGGNFLKEHYDWIAIAVAVAALVGCGVHFFGTLGVEEGALANEKRAAIKRLSPGGEAVKAADLTEFTLVTRLAKTPPKLAEIPAGGGSFLASERRAYCDKCKAIIPADSKTCPQCKVERVVVTDVPIDADGDGLPDVWEKKFGLNPIDPSDAVADADNDGFTNLEEFEAKTDPKDPTSHPDYLDSLKLVLPLQETVLPFVFTGAYKMPSGYKLQFKDPSRANQYDRGVYSLQPGQPIGETGFVVKAYDEKTEKRKIGGGMEKEVDVSEAIVARKSDGKLVRMTRDSKRIPVDIQAKLVYTRGATTKEFAVVVGDTIDLNGTKYVVKDIKRTAKGASVSLDCGGQGKISVLTALEP